MGGRYRGGKLEHLLSDPELIAAIQAAPARPSKSRPPKPPRPREKPKKLVSYKYGMRTGPIFGERLRRFGAEKSRGQPRFRTLNLLWYKN